MIEELRILIVDDHPIVLAGMGGLVKRHFPMSSIVTVDSLATLEARLECDSFDLTILDVRFPDASIFNFITVDHRNHKLGKLVFFSAHFSRSDIEMALSMDASGILSKFEPPEMIVDAVHRILKGDVVISAVVEKFLQFRPAAPGQAQVPTLTMREREVLVHLAKGGSTKEIAKQLYISPKTVDRHRCNIMDKLNVHSQIELSHLAIREGIIHI